MRWSLASQVQAYWHGSPHEVELGGILVPGCELGKDRFELDRNRSVFMTSDRDAAVDLGAGGYMDKTRTFFAEFLYEVEPIGLYPPTDWDSPHDHICPGERQAQQAKVVRRYRCLNPNDESACIARARYEPMDTET